MKNLHMKSLATAVLVSGSLMASTGLMASVSGGGTAAIGATATATNVHNSPGSACEAYNAGQEEQLIANFSSRGHTSGATTASVWIHCPIALGNVQVAPATAAASFNLQMPVGSSSTVYNCYIAEQSLTSSATTARTVAWSQGSGVGAASAGFAAGTVAGIASLANVTATTAAGNFTAFGTTVTTGASYTGGCLLGTGHQLHSFQMTPI